MLWNKDCKRKRIAGNLLYLYISLENMKKVWRGVTHGKWMKCLRGFPSPAKNIITNKCHHLSVNAKPAKFKNGPMIKVLNHTLSTEVLSHFTFLVTVVGFSKKETFLNFPLKSYPQQLHHNKQMSSFVSQCEAREI